MRNLFESPDDFPKMPDMYKYDEESGLYMNIPAQWSKSPYLGAVKDKTGNGYAAQIHIPQAIWEYVIRDNPGKWGDKLPDSYYEENGKNRSTIRIGNLKDPRQAAWISQTVLYGRHDTAELIDEFLTAKYILNKQGISAWKDTFREMPKFSGAPLVLSDRDEWFTRHKEMDTKAKLDKNTSAFNAKAPEKIKQAILAKAAQGGPRKKIFGTNSISLNKLGPIIDKAIDALGIQHFLQGINVKDPMSFDLSKFVTESDIKTGAFREGFKSGYLVETENPYEKFSTDWTEWTDGYLQGKSLVIESTGTGFDAAAAVFMKFKGSKGFSVYKGETAATKHSPSFSRDLILMVDYNAPDKSNFQEELLDVVINFHGDVSDLKQGATKLDDGTVIDKTAGTARVRYTLVRT